MSIWHLVILLIVCALIFGTGKLSHVGSDIGAAIRGFKQSMREGEPPIEPGSVERLDADPRHDGSGVERRPVKDAAPR